MNNCTGQSKDDKAIRSRNKIIIAYIIIIITIEIIARIDFNMTEYIAQLLNV